MIGEVDWRRLELTIGEVDWRSRLENRTEEGNWKRRQEETTAED